MPSGNRQNRRGQADAQWVRQEFHPFVFAPDLAPYTPGAISDAKFMYPTMKGLRTEQALQLRITGITETTLGWFATTFPDGSEYIYAGGSKHLWASSGAAQFVENDNAQTFTGGSNAWTFAMVGSTVIATNGQDPVQAVTAAGGQFSALGGSPPVAKIASAADPGGTGFFAFLFNLQSNSQGWACSGAGNAASWPLDTSNLSASGTLGLTPGPVTAAVPLRGGIVAFKANSFYYGQFIGAPYVWQFQLISPSQGVSGPYAIASAGDVVYFIGSDNIYAFDGYTLSVVPNALAEFLLRTSLDGNHIDAIIGSYDSNNDLVVFRYPSVNASPAGTLDTKIMWCRRSGRWCIGHETVQGALPTNIAATPGTTYLVLTTTYPTYGAITAGTTYANIAAPASKVLLPAVFLSDNNLYLYTGAVRLHSNSPYFITSDIGVEDRQTSLYRSKLKWSIYPASVNIRLQGLGKDNAGLPALPISNTTTLGPRGFFDFRQTARWNNLKYILDDDTEVLGYDVMLADGGWR